MAAVHDLSACRFVLLDPLTGRELPPDHPAMRVATRVFYDECTPAEREAWHRFCCLNSRAPADVAAAEKITRRIEVRGAKEAAEVS